MDEKKIHKIFLEEAFPINIPSPDEAWQNMQQKLAEEDKDKVLAKWRFLYPAAVILILIFISWFLQNDFDTEKETVKKKETNQKIRVKTKTDKDSFHEEVTRNQKRTPQSINRTAGGSSNINNVDRQKQNIFGYLKTKEKNFCSP